MKPATCALALAIILTVVGIWACAHEVMWLGVMCCSAGIGCARESGWHAAAGAVHEWEDEA